MARLEVTTDALTDAFVPYEESGPWRRSVRRRLLSADIIAGSVAGAAVALVSGVPWSELPVVALCVSVTWTLLAWICGLYALDDVRAGAGDVARLLVTALILSWPVYGLLSALDATDAVLGAFTALTLTSLGSGVMRAGARLVQFRWAPPRQRTLIVGSGDVALQAVRNLGLHPELGLDPVGYIDDDVSEPGRLGIPRLGRLDTLADLLASGRVDRVMFALTRAGDEQLLRALRLCRDNDVTIDVAPRPFGQTAFSPAARASKRTLDVVGASLGLILLAPVLALLVLAIRLDSPGRAVFKQQRSGRGGRFFALYKLRTMKVDALVLVREDGAIVKNPDDNRLTRVGRFLRRFSLDETPQLFNVLKGDMSLVGPRALLLAEHAALAEQWQARRADLRPGMTGPWQISGPSRIPFDELVRFDHQYVAGWSLARDIEILLATLPVVLAGRGAD